MAKYIDDIAGPFVSLKAIFYKRLSYWDTMRDLSTIYPNIVDFNYAEKQLYGRVDSVYRPITILPSVIRSFKDSANPRQRVGALNYVVQAFEDMNQQFKKGVMEKQIDSNDRYLSNLKVFKGYEDPKRLYKDYITIIHDVMHEDILQNNIMIKDFDHFLQVFYSDVEMITRAQPITYPAFVKSRFCPMNVSGLVIEIAPGDYNNDQEKFDSFRQSRNWQVYAELCSNYGFMIDQNAPWRLVADINSESLKPYAARRGIYGEATLFKLYYNATYVSYFNSFKSTLLKMYNKFKPPFITETYTCGDGRIKNRITDPMHYTYQDIERLYSDEHFLKLYFKIRLLEEESTQTDQEKRLFFNDCMNAYRADGVDFALFAFERILNLPIDYVGSYNYNDIRRKLLADAAAEQKGATVLPSSFAGEPLSGGGDTGGGGY